MKQSIKKRIQHILLEKDLSIRKIGKMLGEKHPQNLWAKLDRDTIRFTEVEKMLDLLGYEIQIVKIQQIEP